MCPSTCGFDDFGFCVDQVVFDEVQACFDVSILKLNKVQACSDLLLHRYFIQLVTGCLLRNRGGNNTGMFLPCLFYPDTSCCWYSHRATEQADGDRKL